MSGTSPIQSKTSIIVKFAAFVVIVAGVMYAATLVTSVLMALFISIILSQPILWLQKKKVPQGLAIAIVFITVTGIFIGFGEIIATSFSSFSENEAVYEKNLSEMGNSVIEFFNDKGIHISTDNMSDMFVPSKIMSVTAGFLEQLGGFMGNALTIFFLALFLLLEMDTIPVKIKAIVKGTTDSLGFLDAIGDSIRHYLSIKTVTSLLTGLFIWIGLVIIGVDYAIIWALIAFLLNYIPNIGSFIAAVPAVLFAAVQLGLEGVLWTGIVFIVINVVIGNIVEPKMMGKGLGLSTFVVFLSLLFWGFMLGTVGMFLSVPLTMAIKIMLEQDPNTKWLAIVLGTEDEAQTIIDNQKSKTS
ncbi:AI-2E family transporter [Eudoraea sp.]|uniref:AI-2E family transporter n=1 Tax=Eudoraea sp. TaxID=1979955 RepID=UPI003C7671A5